MACALFVKKKLTKYKEKKLTCVPALISAYPQNNEGTASKSPKQNTPNVAQGVQNGENFVTIENLSAGKLPLTFSIGNQEIHMLANYPCQYQQIFVGYATAILENREKDARLQNSIDEESFRLINEKVSSVFKPLIEPNDFFTSYFGKGTAKLLHRVLQNTNVNWLEQEKENIKRNLSSIDLHLDVQGTPQCTYNGLALEKVTVPLTYMDYLMFQITLLGNQFHGLQENYKKEIVKGCYEEAKFEQEYAVKQVRIDWKCVAEKIHTYGNKTENNQN
ncbi:hypothetical protein HMI54_006380 [Coelomomyces lativittatus]|nr:hypothetical protein HMI56_005450 [Coelomomyces lativittatus]KAJ1505022.1 hypothetical protein HMI54_006380 [Coelomomyces lativittatus]